MQENKLHDVIVIGAGPIGSYTGYLLAREGLDVRIFEKNPFAGKDVNCTGIVSMECLKRVKVSNKIIQRQINSIKAFSPSGDFIRYNSVEPLAYVIDRCLFDREVNMMSQKEGATTYFNMRVKEIDNKNGIFKVTVETVDGVKEFNSKVGVIATGFELTSFFGFSNNVIDYSYGIQTEVIMEDVNDVEVYFGKDIAPGSFGWVVPMNDETAKIGLITRKNPSVYLKNFLGHPFIYNRIRKYYKRTKCSPIPLTTIPKSYAERVLIVGEAAGQVKTTTGGGIYFGFLCSEIAVETILKAFKHNNFSENFLSEYERKWRQRIDSELKAGKRFRSIFSRLSDRQIDLIINLAKKDGIISVIKRSDFDWHKDIISYLIRYFIPKKFFDA